MAKKSSTRKSTARKSSSRKRASGKRELINTGRNKMYGTRTASGRFEEMDDVSRSLSADRRRAARKTAKSGYGDQGDRKRGSTKKK